MKLFLIGFMGSGKSYCGHKLAARLDYDYLDLDDRIEEKARQSIASIFTDKGEAHFRQLEANALRAMARRSKLVVSCGGGAPCHHQNMEWMNRHGITIFIDADEELLYQRLHSETQHRPLLKDKSEAELRLFIKQKLAERRPVYQKALIHIRLDKNEEDLDRQIVQTLAGIYM